MDPAFEHEEVTTMLDTRSASTAWLVQPFLPKTLDKLLSVPYRYF